MEGLTYSNLYQIFKKHKVELNKPLAFVQNGALIFIRHKMSAATRYFELQKIIPNEGKITVEISETGGKKTFKSEFFSALNHIEY